MWGGTTCTVNDGASDRTGTAAVNAGRRSRDECLICTVSKIRLRAQGKLCNYFCTWILSVRPFLASPSSFLAIANLRICTRPRTAARVPPQLCAPPSKKNMRIGQSRCSSMNHPAYLQPFDLTRSCWCYFLPVSLPHPFFCVFLFHQSHPQHAQMQRQRGREWIPIEDRSRKNRGRGQ